MFLSPRHFNLIGLALLWLTGCVIGCEAQPDGRRPAPEARAEPASPPAGEDVGAAEVAVWVGEEPIPASAVEERMTVLRDLYRAQRRPFGPRLEALKRDFLIDRLVDETLLRQEAAARGIAVEDDAVEEELAQRIRRRFRTPEHLQHHLARHGESMNEYRARVRDELVTARLLGRGEVRETLEEDEICQLYTTLTKRPSHLDRKPTAHFKALEPTIRERLVQQKLADRRARLLRELRAKKEVRVSKGQHVPTPTRLADAGR